MQPHKKSLNFILVKPAGPDCNMACQYCFYLEKSNLFAESKVHRMSEDVLKEMIRQATTQCEQNISFGWQGGEPTLMGLSFFEKVVYYQQRYGNGKTIGNGLQTNGLVLDYSWGKFLKDYNFLVGLSIDGPEHVHDHYRFLKNGKGSWKKIVDRAKLMLDMGVDVNTLTVVNDYSVEFPEEIYEFHKSLGFSFMQFIPCVETNPVNPAEPAPFSVSAEKYGEFLVKMFNLWQADFVDGAPTTSIRMFDSVLFHYVGLTPPECTLLPTCGIYVLVEHNGNVYPCDFFVEQDWKLGNVMENQLVDMLNSAKQHEFACLKSKLPVVCENCEWLKYCWGGCTKDRIKDPQDQNLSHFCSAYKMFYNHTDFFFKQMAEEWKESQLKADRELSNKQLSQAAFSNTGRNDPCPCGSGKKYKKCCGIKS